MPELARWISSDPYAEKYEIASPYNYVLNTPINAVDPDGRLVIFVNGLLFDRAADYKLNPINIIAGAISDQYAYNPSRFGTKIWREEPRFNGSQIGYWGEIDDIIAEDIFGETMDKVRYLNGSNHFKSQASERFALGKKAGLELIAQLQNGEIQLANEETIKIVGHSQGAAFAAGLLTALADSEYASRLEAGIYLSPHQPLGFEHPDGIFGMQFTTLTDMVSSGITFKGQLMQLFNGGSEFGQIKGLDENDFIHIRINHDSTQGGHEVRTWEDILRQISDFLNSNNEN